MKSIFQPWYHLAAHLRVSRCGVFFILLSVGTIGITHAAWFLDRDNTMIHAKDEVGKSLVSIASKGGKSVGVQVYCPKYKNKSVILTSAHGVLDDPKKALKDRRDLRRPSKQFGYAITMPWSKKYMLNPKKTLTSTPLESTMKELGKSLLQIMLL